MWPVGGLSTKDWPDKALELARSFAQGCFSTNVSALLIVVYTVFFDQDYDMCYTLGAQQRHQLDGK